MKTLEGINSDDIKEGCALELLEEVDEVGSFVEDPLAIPFDVVEMSKVDKYNVVLKCDSILYNDIDRLLVRKTFKQDTCNARQASPTFSTLTTPAPG